MKNRDQVKKILRKLSKNVFLNSSIELADLRGCTIPGRQSEAVMHAGCSDSADLHVEAECGRGAFYNGAFTCHGKWRQVAVL